MYALDCKSFHFINQHFDHKRLNPFFRTITNLGGATFTITAVLLLILLSSGPIRTTAIASALALAISHIPVAIMKKLYPRKRPYLVLENSHVMENPLTDCSFPSGHTTAIFSVVTPFILLYPILLIALLPIAFLVALSRVYLGLHYPSDIIVGSMLGVSSGIICFYLLVNGTAVY
ncbi:phosphatase PAP2 family protein [Ornithinibacillus sp. 179-J 7C1 HS]|uniref:phosphatase PAP2 family protein n=1 Tax=Ornithinibacillus sp. 179-J 7C1 HS TaxID=3142384 RepID=UPI0039A0A84F